jgi:hypothetical protein
MFGRFIRRLGDGAVDCRRRGAHAGSERQHDRRAFAFADERTDRRPVNADTAIDANTGADTAIDANTGADPAIDANTGADTDTRCDTGRGFDGRRNVSHR